MTPETHLLTLLNALCDARDRRLAALDAISVDSALPRRIRDAATRASMEQSSIGCRVVTELHNEIGGSGIDVATDAADNARDGLRAIADGPLNAEQAKKLRAYLDTLLEAVDGVSLDLSHAVDRAMRL